MIEYRAYNEAGVKPELQKVITVGSESFITNLSYTNKDELSEAGHQIIKEHMENLLDYTKVLASQMEMFSDEEASSHPYPVKNLEEVNKYSEEVCQWWAYIFEVTTLYGMKLVLSEEDHLALHSLDTPHLHEESTGATVYLDDAPPHTHDEATGDVVYVEATTTEETPA